MDQLINQSASQSVNQPLCMFYIQVCLSVWLYVCLSFYHLISSSTLASLFILQNSQMDKVNKPTYLITLKTEVCFALVHF